MQIKKNILRALLSLAILSSNSCAINSLEKRIDELSNNLNESIKISKEEERKYDSLYFCIV